MSSINNNQEDVVEKFRVLRGYFDKIYLTSVSSLWVISTFWDIYKLQRYWLDYTVEIYSCFLLVSMGIYALFPNHLPIFIYKCFNSVTTITGKGTLLILIAMLFLFDKHAFHKVLAILLLIGGLLYFCCEILVPTTKEELANIQNSFKERENKKKQANKNITINVSVNNSEENNNNKSFPLAEEREKGDNNRGKNNNGQGGEERGNKINEKETGEGNENESNNEEKIDKSFEGNGGTDNNDNNKVNGLIEDKLPTVKNIITSNKNNNNVNANPYDIPEDF